MPVRRPRYSHEEFSRLGGAMYEQRVRPQVEAGNRGKIVAIDVDSGAFALGETALAASESLLARFPDAQVWCVRIGYPGVHRFGLRTGGVKP